MPLCLNDLPAERIRVFISSAQNEENGFAWSDVRRRIKSSLSQCVYFNPFIIEDEASVMPSLQFFQRQVERADIVVILVKGEVRKGTATEYALSKSLNKPLLVYFLEDENPNETVRELKMELQETDSCTYRPVPDFDNIETIIRSDLMNNLVRTFQDRYYNSALDLDTTVSASLPEDKTLLSTSIPSKTELAKFESCYNMVFDLVELKGYKTEVPKSEAHEFGCNLIRAIISGAFSIDDAEIDEFIGGCTDIFNSTEWLQKRWEAINAYFSGDINAALLFEEEALMLAKAAGESEWVINNILIDCRNFEIDKNSLDRRVIINGKYQKELTSRKHIAFLPILDRYQTNIYEYINKDEFRVATASRSTELIGTSLSHALTDWANYLFSAAVYGSNTHLQISRKLLATLLSRYSIITDDALLAFLSLKQFILFGNSKDTKLYLNSMWDTLYSLVASRADEIWVLSDHVPVTDRDAMKLTIIESIGPFFSEEVFSETEQYLVQYSKSVYQGNSELYFDAILSNIPRMDQEAIVVALTTIIMNKQFYLGNKLSRIILYINLNDVRESVLSDFAIAIKEQLQFIISNNGDPQMIAALVKHNKALFGDLEACPNNGLTGIQEKLYRINTGSQNWLPLLKDEIESAKLQFKANSKKGEYYAFAENPYVMISRIVRNENCGDEIDQTILHDFIPHAAEVLSSEAAVYTKESCVSCLCDVLSSFIERDIDIPDSLIAALRAVDIQKGSVFFSSHSRKTLEIRVFMAKIIAGITGVENLLQIWNDYGKLNYNEKIVIIDCIEKYLFRRRKELDTVSELLVSLVLQCTVEKDQDIRSLAYRCVAYILESPYKEIAEEVINKAVYDPSNKVRITILDVCINDYVPKGISDGLVELLSKDANYSIRERATNAK